MRRYWSYLKYILRHKYYLFSVRKHYKLPLWIAIFHDWDKFMPSQFFPYACHFYNPDGSSKRNPINPKADCDDAFDQAWNNHQKNNKHHWQKWICHYDNGSVKYLEIKEVYLREMLADWYAAGRMWAKSPDTRAWYLKNYENIKLHPDARIFVNNWLGVDSVPIQKLDEAPTHALYQNQGGLWKLVKEGNFNQLKIDAAYKNEVDSALYNVSELFWIFVGIESAVAIYENEDLDPKWVNAKFWIENKYPKR